MRTGFWKAIQLPAYVLAPMANVTDAAFRRLIAEYSRPIGSDGKPSGNLSAIWTEFVSVEGLLSRGKERLLADFWYVEEERPIVAQIFGAKPEQFRAAAELVCELGFDGIDINMGCPDRAVEKQGSGAALIKDPDRAVRIIRETMAGADGLPVSVKTRIGYGTNEMQKWLPPLFDTGISALTVHLRTRNEMSDVDAHWELMVEAVALRDRFDSSDTKPLIFGNGDIKTLADAREKTQQYGCDGAMIGRGIFGTPWFFSGQPEPPLAERLRIMVEHTELFEELFMQPELRLKSFDVMKKHYKAYAAGFDGAKELRIALMETKNSAEVRALTEAFILSL